MKDINYLKQVLASGTANWQVVLLLSTDDHARDYFKVFAYDPASGIRFDLEPFPYHFTPRKAYDFLIDHGISFQVSAFKGIKKLPALLAKYGFSESGDLLPEQPAEQPICTLNHNKPCKICGKTSFKTPKKCANPLNSLSGGWQCQLNTEFVGTALATRKDFIVQYRRGRL
ncbi:MAG: hypothetical protein ACK4GU_13410 [Alishewanella aestuarii]